MFRPTWRGLRWAESSSSSGLGVDRRGWRSARRRKHRAGPMLTEPPRARQALPDWAVVTFDKSTSKAQRDAIATILACLFPVKWKSLTTGEGAIEWTPGQD